MGAVGAVTGLAVLRFALWPLAKRAVAVPRLAGRILSLPLTLLWMASTGLLRGIRGGFRWGAGHLRRTKDARVKEGDAGEARPFEWKWRRHERKAVDLARDRRAPVLLVPELPLGHPDRDATDAGWRSGLPLSPPVEQRTWKGARFFLLGKRYEVHRLEKTGDTLYVVAWPVGANPQEPVGDWIRLEAARVWDRLPLSRA
jgi:hypothetical protein